MISTRAILSLTIPKNLYPVLRHIPEIDTTGGTARWTPYCPRCWESATQSPTWHASDVLINHSIIMLSEKTRSWRQKRWIMRLDRLPTVPGSETNQQTHYLVQKRANVKGTQRMYHLASKMARKNRRRFRSFLRGGVRESIKGWEGRLGLGSEQVGRVLTTDAVPIIWPSSTVISVDFDNRELAVNFLIRPKCLGGFKVG